MYGKFQIHDGSHLPLVIHAPFMNRDHINKNIKISVVVSLKFTIHVSYEFLTDDRFYIFTKIIGEQGPGALYV